MDIRSIAFFCGSHSGHKTLYAEHTVKLGRILADAGISIIYGGGNIGLMGIVANTAMEAGGHVIGVIPEVLVSKERQHTGISELLVVDNMHTRKGLMYEKCDAAVILPGGHGTLDELFEMLTWNQLSIHDKHIFILNSGGYYDHLVAHIDLMYREGMLYSDPSEKISVIREPEEILSFIQPPAR